MDAYDADVLIYAASESPRGRSVRDLFGAAAAQDRPAGVGSALLIPETLSKPLRLGIMSEYHALKDLLGQLDLVAADVQVAQLATSLGATYGLRTLDATHLATAISAGADRFITNNRSDFTDEITEIDISYPDQLE